MIDYQEVLEIHQVLIREFGGLQGVRDENGLKSALERPFSGFGETEFYPNPEEKAGAILESIVKKHPFIDGNKRTGFFCIHLNINLLRPIPKNQKHFVDYRKIKDMRTLNVSIFDIEFNKFGIKKDNLTFTEFVELVSRELMRQNLNKCVELAEKYGLSAMTMDEISEEVNAVRNAKNHH